MQTMEIQATPAPVQIDPARTAVIVIDMQNAFGSPGGMFDKAGIGISGIQAAVAPTRAAVEAARRAGIKIVYLKMGFLPDLSDLGAPGALWLFVVHANGWMFLKTRWLNWPIFIAPISAALSGANAMSVWKTSA